MSDNPGHRVTLSVEENLKAILDSPSYRLAEDDPDFIKSPRMRPLRMAMEVLKPEIAMRDENIQTTLVLFGGTRIVERPVAEKRLEEAREAAARDPDDEALKDKVAVAERVLAKAHYYDEARRLAHMVSVSSQHGGFCHYVVVTGGGPGIMEAGNRGAAEAGAKTIGFNITLPHEQTPNPYVTPRLCFQFHYFAMRKLHFLLRARALVIFPGGFGTLDELFETLTLIQTKVMKPIPVVLFGQEYWSRVIDFDFMVAEGTIAREDVKIFRYAEKAEEAWQHIWEFYSRIDVDRPEHPPSI